MTLTSSESSLASVQTEGPKNIVSLSTSTNFAGTENAVVEDEGTLLTFSIELSEPSPAGGLRVFVDSDVGQILNRLNLPIFLANPQFENIDFGTIGLSLDNSGFAVTVNEGATSASLTIPVFNNQEPDTFLPATFDGLVAATFTLQTEVSTEDQVTIGTLSDYIVGTGETTVLFADTASQLNGQGTEGQVIVGTDGDDTIEGSANDDLIDGGAGNDTISGNGGNDIIDGGTGDDVIAIDSFESSGSAPESIVTVDFSTTTFIEELGNPAPGALESPQVLTVNFTVEGEFDAGAPPVINFASSEPDGLTRFSLTEVEANNLLPAVDVANFEFTDADITLLAPTSSFTIPVFNLPDDRDLDGDGIIEDFAGATEAVQFTISSLTEGVSIDSETAEFTGTFFETVADAEAAEGGGENTPMPVEPDSGIGDGASPIPNVGGEGGTAAGGLGDDIIQGSDRDDVLRGDLNSRDTQDTVAGGNDIIFGGSGNDRIGGKAGNDILSGDDGDDFIWGDDGDDILMGVTGNDTLVGDNFSDSSGSDLFVFGNGDGTDTILDFEVGIDRIGLVEGELTFAELMLIQDGNNALLGVADSGETLAVLNNVQAFTLTENSFEVVPDVSNPNQAITLI